jgi:tetratricopeptide (TPR) repeat protein
MCVLKLAPNFEQRIEVLQKLGVIFGIIYQLDQAIDYFRLCLAEMTEKTDINKRIDILIKIGICFEEKKDYDQALKMYESALELDKTYINTRLHIAWCYFLMKKYMNVINMFDDSLTAEISDAWYIKGRALLELKKYSEAKDCFSKAVLMDKGNAVYINSLGVAECYLTDYTKAWNDFDEATRNQPGFVEIWLNIGMLYETNKEYEEAEMAYNRALTLKPDDKDVKLRKQALREDNRPPIKFMHLEYRVKDTMVPNKNYMDNQFLKKGTELCVLQNNTARNNSEEPKVSDNIPKENPKQEEMKFPEKKDVKEVKQNLNDKSLLSNGVKSSEAKPAEKKELANTKTKSVNKGASQSIKAKSTSMEVPINPQPSVSVRPNPSIPHSTEFNSTIPMQQFGLLPSQLPIQALLNPYDPRVQPNNQMMAFYMQNPMIGSRYSLMANASSMPFVPVMQLQRPTQPSVPEVPSLYQLPGMPQGGVMVMTPYGLPNATQMTRPDNPPFLFGVPRPPYLSSEQYQEQAVNLQRATQMNGGVMRPVSSSPMMAPNFYPILGGYPGRVQGRLPEGYADESGRGIDFRMVYPEEQEAYRQAEQNRNHSFDPNRTGTRRARYE